LVAAARLAHADAVFAGAGALHGYGPLGQAPGKGHDVPLARLVFGIGEQDHVEVAVADMADDGAHQPAAAHVLLRFRHAFGETGDGHADVGGHGGHSREGGLG